MKKVLKISSFIALWATVSFGVWVAIQIAYFIIAAPETFTKFEMIMSLLVSCHIAEELIEIVFEAQEETQKEGADNGKT